MWSLISTFFSTDTIAFSVLGYPLSYLELLGTIFNLWSVWLVARNNIWNWPIGIIGVLLFLVLFYQIRLYADTFEQVYYLFSSVYGWWIWARRDPNTDNLAGVRFSPPRTLLLGIGITLVLTVGLGYITANLHLWLPTLFPAPASFAYLDAFTTVMSFTAMLLMAHKRIECWIYWITVDVIGIGLYWAKDVRFLSLLYMIFLVIATLGLLRWRKQATRLSWRRHDRILPSASSGTKPSSQAQDG